MIDLPPDVRDQIDEIKRRRPPRVAGHAPIGPNFELSHVMQSKNVTQRELQVLDRVAAGYSNQQIADEFELALETIKSHMKRLLWKWSCKTRAQAVAEGFRRGYLV